MAKISVGLDRLEQQLFDGRARITAVAGVNAAYRVIDFNIVGQDVPPCERVTMVVTERNALLLPAVYREVTFEEAPGPQMALDIPPESGSTVTLPESHYMALKQALMAVEQLIACSAGVIGLQRPGEITDWNDLRPGGRHDGWLKSLYHGLDVIEQE